MQTINVLSDDARYTPLVDQLRHGRMALVGHGLLYDRVDRELASPIFAPHVFRSDEILKLYRAILGP
jgi:hypothetical protein